MDQALAFTALMMGVAGGPHCALMCGAAQAGVVRSCSAGAPRQSMLALQIGRFVAYATAGALLAGGVSLVAVARQASPAVGALLVMLQLAAFALGCYLAYSGRQPGWLGGAGGDGSASGTTAPTTTYVRPVRFMTRATGPVRAGGVGLVWVLIPCGLLQSALVVSALASGPAQGAMVMGLFALASSVSLWLAPYLWLRFQRLAQSEKFTRLAVRVAGLVLAASSGLALGHSLGPTLQAICA
ncbi:MAG: sulfite exporter TauE/SafE family protein [Variovorax sp.]